MKYCAVRPNLQQQKLLELTSLFALWLHLSGSTIVEIIRAYQPSAWFPPSSSNLQQQKLLELTSQLTKNMVDMADLQQQKLLELTSQNKWGKASLNLQQQKLLELTSPLRVPDARFPIYNSRNYQSLLAADMLKSKSWAIYNSRNYQSLLAYSYYIYSYLSSTIVEIIRAYQPLSFSLCLIITSTIVEIIRAYQPCLSYVCAI